MSIETIEFTLNDKKGIPHEIIVIERNEKVKFVFPFDVRLCKDGSKSLVLDYMVEGKVKNLAGLIVDRMHRLSEFNHSFESIVINDRKHVLDVEYNEKKKHRDAVFLDGYEIKQGYNVRFVIEDNHQQSVKELKFDYDSIKKMASGEQEVCAMLASASMAIGKIPVKLDERGLPLYTKNTTTNSFLYANGFVNDEHKGVITAINNHLDKVLAIAAESKCKGVNFISLDVLGAKNILSPISELVYMNEKSVKGGRYKMISVDSFLELLGAKSK
ncbi:hypothetical protein LMH73_017080 [Vibrio splendidus]|nr:hypothetical protein [Vibrio splendidus]MCC4880545.1 hypothetical protein [Vibrio splendidus]